ncbi:CidA/LrgA family protein [Microvirga sp. W0021]|uniref:CidA/LrgA family protein n=1 Tax=Hohaiivirga grylli TaxID=3133970 RepID=A0ABV0BG76_9HYPH
MLFGIAVILLCQLIGNITSHAFQLPVPGPVLGLVLLLVFLWARDNFAPVSSSPAYYSVEKTGKYILANMSILFVPASVGIIQKLDIFAHNGWTIAIAIMASTILALAASAYTFIFVARLVGSKESDK